MPKFIAWCLAVAVVAVGCGEDSESTRAAVNEEVTSEQAPSVGKEPATPQARKGALVKIVDSQFGRVVADRRGEALYLFDREKGERSRCYGECAVVWPPLLAKGKPRAARGAREGLLGTTRRRDGRRQVTYAGHPLYYFRDDSPGQILCHNVAEFGGLWLVVKPNGSAAA